MTTLVVIALLAQPGGVVLDNEYLTVLRGQTRCHRPDETTCDERVIVALAPVELWLPDGVRAMDRGDVAVFLGWEMYEVVGDGFVEVSLKPDRPASGAAAVAPATTVGRVVYDGERFLVAEESVAATDAQQPHGHSHRVVVILDAASIPRPAVTEGGRIAPIPDAVTFEGPTVHALDATGSDPLRTLVIELKPEGPPTGRRDR